MLKFFVLVDKTTHFNINMAHTVAILAGINMNYLKNEFK